MQEIYNVHIAIITAMRRDDYYEYVANRLLKKQIMVCSYLVIQNKRLGLRLIKSSKGSFASI